MPKSTKNNVMKNLQCMSTKQIFLYGLLFIVLYNLFNCMFAKSKIREYSNCGSQRKEYMDGGDVMAYTSPKNTPEFVFYFAEWCGHCKRTKPDWMKMPTNINNVSISSVDCVEYDAEAKTMGVKGFPTFLYFPNGRLDPQSKVPYQGPRSVDGWTEFVNKRRGA